MLEYESELVEAAVLHALEGHREERAFRRERNRIYKIRDPEARERAFRDLHAAWFERLGLGWPVAQALGEEPAVSAATGRCRIARARSREEEGAELFVCPPGPGLTERDRCRVVVRLRPEAFRVADRLLLFLRHELLHIADMLDPRFAYEPRLRPEVVGLVPERLLRERYRVLWDATIDGRLARRGLAPHTVRAERFREFVRTFPMLGARAEGAFACFFDGAACTHADLAAFAAGPGGSFDANAEGPHPGERCPLCRFPTHAFAPGPAGLPAEVLGRIRDDFPAWDPAQGLCLQCAELYLVRSSAGSGTGALPASSSATSTTSSSAPSSLATSQPCTTGSPRCSAG